MAPTDLEHAECEDSRRSPLQDNVRQNRRTVQCQARECPDGQQNGEEDWQWRDAVGDLSQHWIACRDSEEGGQ